MDKYLTYSFCYRVRERSRLPMLLIVPIPVTIDKVAPGYTITKAAGPRYELHHRDESTIRRGSDTDLVEFSHYVALTPEELRASALDLEGKPHFMVWE
ncbi:Imm61 family immunity protein [uncultured Leifsonia sp.]|uniref:Imm61 family immunity protein n=1 Tax=uncultured Leifsonia sp. TaxID=340359 RepID=UPI0025D555AD|nr:Imm61 family immunity protein [uncultured Leifsonia sp.]